MITPWYGDGWVEGFRDEGSGESGSDAALWRTAA